MTVSYPRRGPAPRFTPRDRRGRPNSSLRGLRLVLARPLDDFAGARDHLAAVEDEDRDRPLAAEPFDLGTIASPVRPRPEFERPALDLLVLVGVTRLVERLRGFAARMAKGGVGFPAGAGVENH